MPEAYRPPTTAPMLVARPLPYAVEGEANGVVSHRLELPPSYGAPAFMAVDLRLHGGLVRTFRFEIPAEKLGWTPRTTFRGLAELMTEADWAEAKAESGRAGETTRRAA